MVNADYPDTPYPGLRRELRAGAQIVIRETLDGWIRAELDRPSGFATTRLTLREALGRLEEMANGG